MKFFVAGSALAVAMIAGVSTAAFAGPGVKASAFSPDTVSALWCSAVFYEETFWHEPDSPVWYRLDQLSLTTEDIATTAALSEGFSQDNVIEIWEAYANDAYSFYEANQDGFATDLADCETRYGDLFVDDTKG